jgi:glycine cleavage system aminomethyltransferase T
MIDPHHTCLWSRRKLSELGFADSTLFGAGVSLRVVLHAFVNKSLVWFSTVHGMFDDNILLVAVDTASADGLERSKHQDTSFMESAFGRAGAFEEYQLSPTVKALRLTYVGELGWELYVPTEFSLHVFDVLMGAGWEVGLKHAGLHALETLRLEKAYRDYGVDIDNTDTPLEAGLGFAVDFDKPGGFIGREALLRHGVLKYRLVQFLLDDPEPLLYGGEPIYRDGERVGYLNSGGYGHTLGGSVGLGSVCNEAGVTPDYVKRGSYRDGGRALSGPGVVATAV